jgi:hypothetical protein
MVEKRSPRDGTVTEVEVEEIDHTAVGRRTFPLSDTLRMKLNQICRDLHERRGFAIVRGPRPKSNPVAASDAGVNNTPDVNSDTPNVNSDTFETKSITSDTNSDTTKASSDTTEASSVATTEDNRLEAKVDAEAKRDDLDMFLGVASYVGEIRGAQDRKGTMVCKKTPSQEAPPLAPPFIERQADQI